jgi:hypothetical protein
MTLFYIHVLIGLHMYLTNFFNIFCFIFTQQRYLDEDVKSYRQSMFAESTKATYKSHLRSFLRFCLYIGYEPLPCTVETICRYIAFLARSLSYSSIPGYLNIIRLLHVE